MARKRNAPKVDPIPPDEIEAALAKGFQGRPWEPTEDRYGPTPCPGCGVGHVLWIGGATNYTFICDSRCGWECPDEERTKAYKAKLKLQKKKAKKVKPVVFVPDAPELVQAIRAECARRMEILLAERAKFPPTFTKKGKPNKKFTEAMRVHMHGFAFTAEQVRDEILKAHSTIG